MLFLPKLRSEEVSVVHLAKLRFVNQTNPASNAADPHDFFIGFLGTKKPTAQKHRMKKSNFALSCPLRDASFKVQSGFSVQKCCVLISECQELTRR